ncbi:MAG: hypothetical protein CBC55_04490 [Gammaproteobacteria bacterium TMED95]|nr:MAG: hypothetical protein CBC55_04490 [Gammaproteobacteria bacterium TMED95]
MKKIFLAGLFASLFAANVSAELVSTELNGLKTVTNTETGVEWLSLTETKMMSFADSVAATQNGGIFQEWRLPTENEVATMFQSQVFTDRDAYFDNTNYRGTVYDHNNYHTLFGEYEGENANTTNAVYLRDDGSLAFVGVYRNSGGFHHLFGMTYSQQVDADTAYGAGNQDVGALLIRANTPLNANYAYLYEGGSKVVYGDVPAPFTLAFLPMAFLIPGVRRRCKSSIHRAKYSI